MPKGRGPNKARKKKWNLTSKFYTHTGGPKGRSGYAGVKAKRKGWTDDSGRSRGKGSNTTKTKRKHGRK